jgi:hypothetical protein
MFSSIFQAVWSGKYMVIVARTIILLSESRWTHDHILPSHNSGSRATAARLLNRGMSTSVLLLVNCPMHQAITMWKHGSEI